jgi:type VI secretion system protein VasG
MGYGRRWQVLLGWLDKQPRSVTLARSSLNHQTLMQEAWLIASLAEEQIRSAPADGAG